MSITLQRLSHWGVAIVVGAMLLVVPQITFAQSFTVNTGTDELDGSCSDGDCSFRDAISLAQNNGGSELGDVITVDASVGRIEMALAGTGDNANNTGDFDMRAQSDVLFDQTLTINGNGVVIDGNGLDRLLDIDGSGANYLTVSIDDVVLTGSAAVGGSVLSNSINGITTLSNSTIQNINLTATTAVDGLLIGNDGDQLTLDHVTIENITATKGMGGNINGLVSSYNGIMTLSSVRMHDVTVNNYTGEALIIGFNSLMINDSLFAHITVTAPSGMTVGTMVETLSDSTISNTAFTDIIVDVQGSSEANLGVILFNDSATVNLSHVTASSITVDGGSNSGQSLIYATGAGVVTNIDNSVFDDVQIISNDSTTTNDVCRIDSGTLNFTGTTIDPGATCAAEATTGSGNVTSSTDALLTTITDVTTGLSLPLPSATSPALDVVAPEDCTLDTDARGITRPQGSGCDLGALERQVDNDSDGQTADSDCDDADSTITENQTYYEDADGDGLGNPASSTSVCSLTAPAGYVSNNTDTDDTPSEENPPLVDTPTITAISGSTAGKITVTYSDDTTGFETIFGNYTGSKTTQIHYLPKRKIYLITHPLGKALVAIKLSTDKTTIETLDTIKLSKKASYQKTAVGVLKKSVNGKKVLGVTMNNRKKKISAVALVQLNTVGNDNVFIKKATYQFKKKQLNLKKKPVVSTGLTKKNRQVTVTTTSKKQPKFKLLLTIKTWKLTSYPTP